MVLNRTTAACAAKDHHRDIPAVSIGAIVLVGLAGASMAVVVPGVTTAFVTTHTLSASQASYLAAGELSGMTAAGAIVSTLLRGTNRRILVCCALAAMILLNMLSASTERFWILLSYRIVAGVCEGSLFALMSASMAGTASPERNFAIFLACNLGLSTVFFRTFPIIIEKFGIRGIFYFLTLIAALAAASLRYFPPDGPSVTEPMAVARGNRAAARHAVFLSLLGLLVFFTGIGAVWPLMGRFGLVLKFSDREIAYALGNATIVGIVSAIFASWLGVRMGRSAPLMGGIVVLVVATLFLLGVDRPAAFDIDVSIFLAAWVFVVPYCMGVLSMIDAQGRVAALGITMNFAGMTLGTLLGSNFMRMSGYSGAVLLGSVMIAISLPITLVANRYKAV